MEIIIWLLFFMVSTVIFMLFKIHKNSPQVNQKNYLERYAQIKKVNPDYRVQLLKDWERDIYRELNNKNAVSKARIVDIQQFR